MGNHIQHKEMFKLGTVAQITAVERSTLLLAGFTFNVFDDTLAVNVLTFSHLSLREIKMNKNSLFAQT